MAAISLPSGFQAAAPYASLKLVTPVVGVTQSKPPSCDSGASSAPLALRSLERVRFFGYLP